MLDRFASRYVQHMRPRERPKLGREVSIAIVSRKSGSWRWASACESTEGYFEKLWAIPLPRQRRFRQGRRVDQDGLGPALVKLKTGIPAQKPVFLFESLKLQNENSEALVIVVIAVTVMVVTVMIAVLIAHQVVHCPLVAAAVALPVVFASAPLNPRMPVFFPIVYV